MNSELDLTGFKITGTELGLILKAGVNLKKIILGELEQKGSIPLDCPIPTLEEIDFGKNEIFSYNLNSLFTYAPNLKKIHYDHENLDLNDGTYRFLDRSKQLLKQSRSS